MDTKKKNLEQAIVVVVVLGALLVAAGLFWLSPLAAITYLFGYIGAFGVWKIADDDNEREIFLSGTMMCGVLTMTRTMFALYSLFAGDFVNGYALVLPMIRKILAI